MTNKLQAESYYNVKEINKVLRANKRQARHYVEKNMFGDYEHKVNYISGNLPDKLKEIVINKKIISEYFEAKKKAVLNENN